IDGAGGPAGGPWSAAPTGPGAGQAGLRRHAARLGGTSRCRRSPHRSPASAGASCRRLAAQVQGLASRPATESPGERPPVPQAAARPAGPFAAATAPLQRPAPAKTENYSAAHGNLGAPDRRAEEGGQDGVHQDPPVAAGAPQADGRGHSRLAQNGSPTARAGAGLSRVPQQVL